MTFASDLTAALALLERVADDRSVLVDVSAEQRAQLQRLCGVIARPDLKDRKKLQKALLQQEHQQKKAADDERRKDTGIRQLRAQPVFITPPALQLSAPVDDTETVDADASIHDQQHDQQHDHRHDDQRDGDVDNTLHEARICYVCKQPYQKLHTFYDQLCPTLR